MIRWPKNYTTTKLEPNVAYELNLSNIGVVYHEFNNGYKCKKSFVKCPPPNLYLNNCETAGLKLIYKLPKMELRQKICTPNHIYHQDLEFNSTVISKFWLKSFPNNATDLNVFCYIWCTN